MRLLFFIIYGNVENSIQGEEWLKAAFIGIRFDLRLAVIIFLPTIPISILPLTNTVRVPVLRTILSVYLKFISLILLLFYTADFGHYGYLGRRIDISAVQLLENPLISFQMVWESYPVLWVLVGIILALFVLFRVIDRLITLLDRPPRFPSLSWRFMEMVFAGVLFLFCLWGSFRQYPLRWSDAFFSQNGFISALALNPILYFQDTKKFSQADFSIEEAKNGYSRIAEYLKVDQPDSESLNYVRTVQGKQGIRPPNIVIIFLESVGANRMGLLGNPINPTPNLDNLAREGLFFSRFYIPFPGTARAVFNMVTGIPDVARVKTSSRNPLIKEQGSLVKFLEGYEKHYLLGGSASWASIRGLLQYNIPDIRITELGDFISPRLDVWGISDHDLFRESHEIFSRIDKNTPFFAVIQTATNHKPYSIPDHIKDFKVLQKDLSDIDKAGFKSNGQLNALRLLDHAVGEYFSYARDAEYFDNTLFFLFGDHGTSDPWARHMPPADFELTLRSYHVPFIIYGKPLKSRGIFREDVACLSDLMPTVLGLAGTPYTNRTLGRDLLSTPLNKDRVALLVGRDRAYPRIGVVGPRYYLTINADGTDPLLHDIYSKSPLLDRRHEFPEIAEEYESLALGLYNTARYLLYHNKH